MDLIDETQQALTPAEQQAEKERLAWAAYENARRKRIAARRR